jgi:hypothetical protein
MYQNKLPTVEERPKIGVKHNSAFTPVIAYQGKFKD